MFRLNWPSSGVQVVVVVEESAAHCNAVLLCSCLGFKVMWVNHLFYSVVLEQLICTCLRFYWFMAVMNVFVWPEVLLYTCRDEYHVV
jgi:hypothetical protein